MLIEVPITKRERWLMRVMDDYCLTHIRQLTDLREKIAEVRANDAKRRPSSKRTEKK